MAPLQASSVGRRLVREGDVCFADGFPHIPDASRVEREKDRISGSYLNRLAAFRREKAVTSDEMAQLGLFHLAGPHARHAFPYPSFDLLVW
jgi:hypothetical protein